MDIEKLTALLSATLYQPHRSEAEEQLQRVSMLFRVCGSPRPTARAALRHHHARCARDSMLTVEGYVKIPHAHSVRSIRLPVPLMVIFVQGAHYPSFDVTAMTGETTALRGYGLNVLPGCVANDAPKPESPAGTGCCALRIADTRDAISAVPSQPCHFIVSCPIRFVASTRFVDLHHRFSNACIYYVFSFLSDFGEHNNSNILFIFN